MEDPNVRTRKVLRFAGVALLIVGIIILIHGFIHFDVFTGSFRESAERTKIWFGTTAIGMFLIFIGGVMLYFGMLRPVSKYVATEVSPAITTVSRAFGKGLADTVDLTRTREVVKIKCPYCGYLESEDAKYCSKCGRKL